MTGRPADEAGSHAPRTVAAIDIGSNSLQMTIARVTTTDLEIIHRSKAGLRLGAAITEERRLTRELILTISETLADYQRVAAEHNAELRVSATAAVRSAKDASELLETVLNDTGIRIRIISPIMEARLVREGVCFGRSDLAAQPMLCVDVGGGSTEFTVGAHGQLHLVTSIPWGTSTVHARWIKDDPVPGARVRRARRELRRRFGGIATLIRRTTYERQIATGGSVQRLARLIAARRGQPVHDVADFDFTSEELRQVTDDLVSARTQSNRLRIPGMDPTRADVLLGGALFFEALGDLLNLNGWTVSMNALRAGLLTTETWT